jgi:hypothetical protein
MSAAGAATFNDNIAIGVGKKLLMGGGSHTYISEDIDDRVRHFVGGTELLRLTEDSTNTVNIYASLTQDGGAVFNEASADVDFRVESDGNTHMLFVDSGNNAVNIGTVTHLGDVLNVSGGAHLTSNVTLSRQTNDSGSTGLIMEKTRSTTVNGNTVVNNGDQLGFVGFKGNDGDQFVDAAFIIANVDGTPGNNDMPASLSFHTTADGASSVTQRMTINNQGNVGIGVNDGDVTSDGNSNRTYVGIIGSGNRGRLNLGTTASNGADSGFLGFTNGANTLANISVDTASGAQTTGTLFINGTGNIDIQSPVNYGVIFNEDSVDADFRVESDNETHAFFIDAGNDRVLIGNSANPTGEDFLRLDANPGVSGHIILSGRDDTSTKNHHVFINPNGTVGSIQTAGSATAYNTSSDARLKENITDADEAGELIDAIQVRKFDWKADGEHQRYGMIAQELQTVAPEAVSEGETAEDMMGVDYSKLVPMLVKEIQTLRARVADLES